MNKLALFSLGVLVVLAQRTWFPAEVPDWALHAAGFALAGAMAAPAVGDLWFVVTFAALDELRQLGMEHRSGSLADFLVDLYAALGGWFVVSLVRGKSAMELLR